VAQKKLSRLPATAGKEKFPRRTVPCSWPVKYVWKGLGFSVEIARPYSLAQGATIGSTRIARARGGMKHGEQGHPRRAGFATLAKNVPHIRLLVRPSKQILRKGASVGETYCCQAQTHPGRTSNRSPCPSTQPQGCPSLGSHPALITEPRFHGCAGRVVCRPVTP